MKTYKAHHRTLGVASIEAHRMERDGSGTRFFDENGDTVAAFGDGEITSVVDASIVFEEPLPPPSPETVTDENA